MRIIILCLIVLCSCQSTKEKHRCGEDSPPIDSTIQDLLNRQQAFVKEGKPDSAVMIGKSIREKAILLSDTLSIARSILSLVEDADATDRESQVEWLERIIPFLDRKNLHFESIQARVMLSGHLSSNGNYQASQTLIIPAWKSAETHGYLNLLPKIGLIISNNFSGIQQSAASIAFLHASTRFARELKDSSILPSLLMNIGIWHYEQESDSANHYYLQALSAIPVGRADFMRMKVLYNMAVELEREGKYDDAAARYQEMANTSQQQGQFEALAVAYKALGSLYRLQGRLPASRQLLEQSTQLADSIRQGFLKLQGMIELQATLEDMKAFKAALELSKQVKDVKDSIIGVEQKLAIIELEQKYQTEKKETENRLLKQLLQFEQRFNVALIVIVLIMIPLMIILYQRKKFQQERNRSYQALIELYQREKKEARMKPSSAEQADPVLMPVPPEENPEKHFSEAELSDNIQMIDAIRHLIASERLFVNPQLKQEDLAEKLNITPRRLSAYLRWSNPPGFNALINDFRVKEARLLLESADHAHLKLDAISQMAGFSSRSYFYKVFEQQTGLNPGYYRKKMG